MEGTIKLVQTHNDRDIFKLSRQLELGLIFLDESSIRAGGQLRSQLIHTVDFSTISSIKALNLAWKKFSSGKKSRPDVAEYQKQLKININNLYVDIASGNYEHGKYQPFMICDPKQRQIHKATVRDRLVHQVIVSAIEPLFERQFIYDSYSCRVGKGTHAGVRRFRTFLGQASCNNTQKVYVLKCDVRKFFASIDHETLLRLITRRITDEAILELVRTIVLSHGAETGKGIPLGNVTSQLFANIYLHELDWFIKQTLGIKHYLRYCDDFVIVSTDKSYLQSLIDPIRSFLKYELRLDLHPTKVSIRPWSLGVDFLGHVLLPHATMLRTKTKSRMLARVTEQNLSSYLGICSHVQAYRVSQVVQLVAWQRHEELA